MATHSSVLAWRIPGTESPLLVYNAVHLWCASRVPPVSCQSLFLFSLMAPSDFFFTSALPSTFGSNSQSKGPTSFRRWRLGELQILWVLGLSEWWKEWRWAWGGTGPAQREEQGVKLPFLSPSSWAWQIFKIIKIYLADTGQLLQKNSNGLLANLVSLFSFHLTKKSCSTVTEMDK